MLKDLFAAVRDRQSVKEIAVVDFLALFGALIFKEAADHKLIERLAEAARAGKQRDLGIALDQIPCIIKRFVDKISVFFNNRFKILHADGDFFSNFSCLFIGRSSFLSPRIHTFPRAAGNQPC